MATSRARSRASWVVGAYALVATLWILLSDRALALLAPDPQLLLEWSILKGMAFVATTSSLLWIFVRRAFAELERAYDSLSTTASELERLTRLHASLSQINQTIARSESPENLHRRVCQALVEHGGFRLAWIGWHDAATSRIVPIAEWGDRNGYVKGLSIYSDQRPDGSGPLGTAFREGRTYVCNDLLRDPATAPWREEVMAQGVHSGAALPIRVDGTVRGLLAVYAAERDFFQQREIELLHGASVDLSFALENFARQAEHRQASLALRASEERFRNTLEAMLEGCQVIGFDWRYLYLNAAAARHNRRPNEELLGRTMQECWPGIEASDIYCMLERCLRERIALHRETEFVFPDGSSGWFDVRCQPMAEGIFVLSIDISDRKEAERELLELNATLERRVVERTTALAAAVGRAEAADRLKSAFLATMSHELRTPLNSIIGFTGILLQGLAGPLNEEQSKQLGMVRGSARHLLDLINDVLDLSKIEAGQLEVRLAPFALGESIERVVALVRPLAAARGLTLDLAVSALPAELVSDRRRVEQVLLNLLHNAIKFTDRGGVRLTVDTPDLIEPCVRFRVADTGIGIQAHDLANLFQPFRQLDSGLARQHEGTGLGLAICRRLASLLGGSVAASSVFGEGSEFTLLLPLRGPD